ncbi:MAG: argininosuccinate lyase [Polyangiaceae bacterium]|nr:argininosuccinate lyase [Polyangiaceae bacterium]
MSDTGRIRQPVARAARRIVFGEDADRAIDAELGLVTEVDRAHLVMLAEAGLVDAARAGRLLGAIGELRASGFTPLRGRRAPRGLYLLYEGYLIERLGMETGGVLQTARSRNDLNATVLALRLRAPGSALVRELLRLQAVLLRRAERYRSVTMPAYTHLQPAVPVTYGHYLAGVAEALARDVDGVRAALGGFARCPLGAGAVGGTTLPVRAGRVAELLGFDEPVRHSIDAVASRDGVLRLLGAAAVAGVTLGRLAADLQLWATQEFAFLRLSDAAVGSSSMMPQKRNPYLLEHVRGRGAAPLGAFVAAAGAAHGVPFTNHIAVGTEAVSHLWPALRALGEAATLARVVAADATPEPAAMLARAERGYTAATELANRLTAAGVPFREAHGRVGRLVVEALERGGESLSAAAERWGEALGPGVDLGGLDAASVARATCYGGGPGGEGFRACVGALRAHWTANAAAERARAWRWREAAGALEAAAGALEATGAGRGGGCVEGLGAHAADGKNSHCQVGREPNRRHTHGALARGHGPFPARAMGPGRRPRSKRWRKPSPEAPALADRVAGDLTVGPQFGATRPKAWAVSVKATTGWEGSPSRGERPRREARAPVGRAGGRPPRPDDRSFAPHSRAWCAPRGS